MKQRFRLYKRKNGGRFYLHDEVTGKQESLDTSDRTVATRLLHSRNEAEQQPAVNLQIARAYLAAADKEIATRNWQFVMDEMVKLKKDETQRRWQTAIKDKAFDSIRNLPLLETRPEHFLRVLEAGKISTNAYLRRIHSFALDMTWLPWPVLPKKRWPAVEFKEKRSITLAEHLAIIARELNPERKALYKLAWHLGAAQTDIARLDAQNVDWEHHYISFRTSPDGGMIPQLLLTILQRTVVPADAADAVGAEMIFEGGCTLTADLRSCKIRYCIRKDTNSQGRLSRQQNFAATSSGSRRAVYFGAPSLKSEISEPFAAIYRGV